MLCIAVCASCSFFFHDCYLLLPAASGCSGRAAWVTSKSRVAQQRDALEFWAGSEWQYSGKPWHTDVWWRRLRLPACQGSSVLYHSCFPLFCSQVFCLFFIVPFMCFPSLQKSLALFKIDQEWLPRLYPEREREKNAWTPSSYRVIKSFHSPSRSLNIPETWSSQEKLCIVTIALPARATKALLLRRVHLITQSCLPRSACKCLHKCHAVILVFVCSALNI